MRIIISRSGTISSLDLDNEVGGTINATGVLILNTGNPIENAGLMEATAGGDLILNTEAVTNTGTVEVADTGSKLELRGSSITGGTVTNKGTFEADSGSNAIHDATITNSGSGAVLEATGAGVTLTIDQSSTVANTGLLEAINGGDLILNTVTVTNTGGTVEVADTGSKLELQGASITGGTVTNNGTFEADSGNTNAIHGATVTNNAEATLEATGSGVSLIIDANSTVTNNGLLEATGGAIFTLATGNAIHNESLGVLEATSGGTLVIQDNVQNDSGGQLKALGGTIDVQGGGTITNDTAINGIVVDSTGVLQFEVATLELLGAGGVQLTGGTIQGTGSNTLDNDGNTIAGYGLITSLTLENGDIAASTIDANVSGLGSWAGEASGSVCDGGTAPSN